MFLLYEVKECFDKDVKTIAIFQNKASADILTKRINVPGSMSSTYIIELWAYMDIQDYELNNPEALKQQALAKLTPQDKEVLGLK
jgi:hypothetical protein